jgi:hypothetical protein
MNALSNVSMRAIPDTRTDAHPTKTIALFRSLVGRIPLRGIARPGLSAGFSWRS